MSKITVKGLDITVVSNNGNDEICLTDMVKNMDNNNSIISNWMRQKNTLEYLALWEKMNNPGFKLFDFEELTKDAGLNRFTMSPKKWIDATGAIGISSKAGKNGGTYAHKDIAFHFGLWLSPEFNLLLIREFQRLKDEEARRLNSEWDYRRFLSKANYTIHTNAIQKFVIPKITDEERKKWIYAEEGDLLNVALFGFTAKQWRDSNPELVLKGYNVRDIADAHQLLVLSNLEGYNAILNQQGLDKYQRLLLLKKAGEQQLSALRNSAYSEDRIKSPFLPEKKNHEIPRVGPAKDSSFGDLLGAVSKVPKPEKDK